MSIERLVNKKGSYLGVGCVLSSQLYLLLWLRACVFYMRVAPFYNAIHKSKLSTREQSAAGEHSRIVGIFSASISLEEKRKKVKAIRNKLLS